MEHIDKTVRKQIQSMKKIMGLVELCIDTYDTLTEETKQLLRTEMCIDKITFVHIKAKLDNVIADEPTIKKANEQH